jgi:DNA mismatch repair protein MutS
LRNFNVAVREAGDQILFLHRLEPGGADRSYGIEVGRLAGLPAEVIQRARRVLALLEGEQLVRGLDAPPGGKQAPATDQLGLFASATHPVVEQLALVDANTLTPLEALSLLAKLADDARQQR